MPADPRRATFLSALLGALVVAVVFGALALGGAFDDDDDDDASAPAAVQRTADDDSDRREPSGAVIATDVSGIYDEVRAGVVSVETRTGGSPLARGEPQGGSGSGFVIDDKGFILTNDHVVEGADRVRVRFDEGGPVTAEVVGTDPGSDLALIKVDSDGLDLEPIGLGSSENLRVGEPTIAMGSPFGLDDTLTTGVVSALERSIQAPNGFTISNVVQTDAAINPGNSGGPLLDVDGRAIGVNAQIATSSRSNSGVGFAVPIDTAKDVLPQLRRGEEVDRPFLGVSTQAPPNGTGALVAQVVPGGPAARGGIRKGDRIVAIGDEEVDQSDEVASNVIKSDPGDRVQIRVRRDGEERTVTVRLGTQPDRAARIRLSP